MGLVSYKDEEPKEIFRSPQVTAPFGAPCGANIEAATVIQCMSHAMISIHIYIREILSSPRADDGSHLQAHVGPTDGSSY